MSQRKLIQPLLTPAEEKQLLLNLLEDSDAEAAAYSRRLLELHYRQEETSK